MRSGMVAITTFLCCVLAVIAVMTVGSFNLQRDELERAVDFCVKQTARECIAKEIEDKEEIEAIAANAFSSQINSKKGTLNLFILYADKNVIDIAANFSYSQYNGSVKRISCRKTLIRDWEDGKENEGETRFINKDYAKKAPEGGGLKENSVWKDDSLLDYIFANKQYEDGSWESYENVVELKYQT